MKMTPLFAAVAVLLSACASLLPATPRALVTAPAPISFDGHVAGQATDYVFVLVPDANPLQPGFSLGAGDSLRLAMPRAFRRNPAAAVVPDKDTNLVLTKGWPQGGVRMADQYRLAFDEAAHALVITALRDVTVEGANTPGIKVIHLRGRTFLNPVAGDYPVTLTHAAANGQVRATWQGSLKVLDRAPDARLAPTNFHLQPGLNSDFQSVPVGQVAPHPLGLLLWGAQGAPLNGVGVAPRDLTRFPRYTGGLLVQDRNGDKKLDPATDTVVGGIIGAAPQGATGQAATSPLGADGLPVLSGEPLRHAAFPGGGGQPNPGLLDIQFRAGSLPGLYQPTVELIGGNSYRFTVQAVVR